MRDGLLIHVGINFIFLPQPHFTRLTGPAFQTALVKNGIDVSQTLATDDTITVGGREPSPYEVRLISLPQNVGQLVILGSQGTGTVDIFTETADAILQAYDETMQTGARRLLASDATLRFLYETGADHAFRQLWENRLHQSSDSLTTLGGPVLGGGLRFVVPLAESQAEQCLVEVKIESLLADASKLYVETIIKWDFNNSPDATPDIARRLKLVNEYAEQKVAAFMDWEDNSE